MSIIDEALKKTQQNLNQKSQNPDDKSVTDIYEKLHKTDASKKIAPDSNPHVTKKGNPLVKILIFLIIVAVGYYGYLFLNPGKNKDVTEAINKFKASLPKTKKQQTTTAPAPTPVKAKVYAEDEIVLNGIMYTAANQRALINDKIYEIGDQIKGKQITSITEDSVELTDESGMTTKLTTRN